MSILFGRRPSRLVVGRCAVWKVKAGLTDAGSSISFKRRVNCSLESRCIGGHDAKRDGPGPVKFFPPTSVTVPLFSPISVFSSEVDGVVFARYEYFVVIGAYTTGSIREPCRTRFFDCGDGRHRQCLARRYERAISGAAVLPMPLTIMFAVPAPTLLSK